MKIAGLVLTAGAVAAAQPHKHQHRHVHEKKAVVTEFAPVATMTVYEYNGSDIPVSQVCSGLAEGDMTWAADGGPLSVCTAAATSSSTTTTTWSSSTTTTSSSTTSSASSSGAGEFFQQSSSSAAATTWTSAAAAATSAASGGGVDSPFPDGTIACSSFPSDYGAVYIDYLNLGGWIGLQTVGAGNTNIVTGVAGESCSEGMYCSYACPPGYQKSQWPTTQGATGQSIGGLLCKDGMLHLTNPSLSSQICMAGVGGVTAQNNAGGVVSICRTDYPGTESETVPTVLEAGSSAALTVPDAGNYYVWQGKSTSAQYYLNPVGYGASDACQWGSPGTPLGNYAPMNFGIGAKDGITWLSLMSNTPTTTATFEGTVEIQGSNLSGVCKYSNGQYCGPAGCNSAGCTVSIVSGTATYVIS